MVLTIYDRAGNPQAELAPNDNSTQAKEIQGDNVLTLSFTLYEHVELDVDDYVDFEGERYWLTEQYRPKQVSTREWKYDLKLYGVESLLRNILVIKTVDDENEPVFTLTAPPREHVAMVVKCMNDGWNNTTDWKVGQVDGAENIVIDYFGKYCDEALREIAEKVGAEYWTEGQTVNVCRCEHGEPITLGYNNGLTSIDPGKADNVKFYTRLWPVGSSRNIDPEKYGHTRLQLPDGQRFVEVNADRYGRVDHYESDAFADIYPRRTGTVSSVRSEVKKGEDGNDFTIYYFRDNSLPFNPNDYEIGGLVKRVSFQEGSELAGLGDEEDSTYYFEVNYNADTREFEIITIWPYDNDMQLPGGSLIPKAGDRYILWNLRMPDEYYRLAEEEFLTAVNKYNSDHALDISVFKAPTDHVWIEEQQADLFIGRRVRLESDKYFPRTGYRDSRITKITRKVNLPSQMDIEIGDALSRTSKAKMTDDINSVRSYAQSIGASISLPDIIRTGDRTLPTDNNLFSARRSQKEFLSRLKDDRSAGKIASDAGFEAGRYVRGLAGGFIDAGGNLEMESGVFRSYVKIFELIYNRLNSLEGDTSFADSGTIETFTDNGDGTGCAVMRRRWDGDFTAFQPGDILYGYANDIERDSETGELHSGSRGLTYFKAWARVTAVDRIANTLTLVRYADTEVPAKVNFNMTASMTVARWGNVIAPNVDSASNPDYASFIRRNADGSYTNTRQQSFYLSCEQGHLMELIGVDSPILRPGNYGTVLGQLPEGLITDPAVLQLINRGQPYLYARGIVVQDLIRLGYQGLQVRTPNFRGKWDAATAASERDYYRRADDLEDITSHDGALWQCLVQHAGVQPPSDINPDWVRLTDFNIRVWAIVPSTNVIYIRRDSYSTGLLECRVTVDNGGSTVRISTPEQLDTYGAKLCFSLDGVTYREFWVRQGDTVGGLTTATGESLEMGGNNVPWSQINDFIYLYVIDNTSGAQLASYRVAVVRDGSDGSDGNDGQTPPHIETRYTVTNSSGTPPAINKDQRDPSTAAVKWRTGSPQATSLQYVWQTTATIDADDNPVTPWGDPVRLTGTTGRKGDPGKDGVGRLAYPCGAFDSNVTYISTDTMQPVVLDGQMFYILKPSKSYRGAEAPANRNTPAKDYAAGGDGASWEWMERMRYVFAEIVMAEMAKLGSFVFSGTSLFSQQGVYEKDGETDLESTSYQHYGDGFTPNFEVDGKTGRVKARHGEFSGWFRLSEVVITPGNIGGYGHIVDQDSTTVTYQLRCSETGTMLRFRGDFATGYGDGTKRCRIQLLLPYMDYMCSDGRPDEIRAYCGSSALIINESVTVEGGTSSWGSTSGDRGGSASRPVAGRSDLVIIGAIATQPTGNGTFNHDIPLKPGWAVHLRAELGYAEEMGAADPTVMYEQLVWRTSGAVKMRTTILDA